MRTRWCYLSGSVAALQILAALGGGSPLAAGHASAADRTEPFRAARIVAGALVNVAPQASDEVFVAATGPGLDTGCTYRNDGPLLITIPVSRVVTNPSATLATLKANGYITDATLSLMAYDVDFEGDASAPFPERDKVYFNGHLCAEQYLRGTNDAWHLNTFKIPIEWVNFPSDPGDHNLVSPASNVIRIDIDTENVEEEWCTAIDYAALSFKAARPVVLVHGMVSSGGTWASPGIWRAKLTEEGIPFSNGLDFYPNSTIASDYTVLRDWILAAKNQWGVNKVALVCHSKGGISARKCASTGSDVSNDVSDLVQIGTPNLGSPLADLAEGFLAIPDPKAYVISRFIQAWKGSNNLSELTSSRLNDFNSADTPNSKVKYTALGGYYERTSALTLEDLTSLIDGMEPGDGVVPLASALALPGASTIPYQPGPGDESATHTGLITSETVFDLLKRRAIPPTFMRMGGEDTLRLEPVTGFWEIAAAHDTLNVGNIEVDEAVPTLFSILHPEGDVDFWLKSPSGQLYKTSTLPDSGFDRGNFDLLGAPLSLYRFQSPEVGTWTAYASVFSDPTPADSTVYWVNSWLLEPQVSLRAYATNSHVATGATIEYRARVANAGTGIAGATVVAYVLRPDGQRYTVTLADGGVAPDSIANDGLYTGALTATSVPGRYTAYVSAVRSGVPGQPDFSRTAQVAVAVSASTSTFTGSISDYGEDTNGNGYYDSLVVAVGVQITTAGRYRVVGVLSDSLEDELKVGAEAVLQPGTRTIYLRFSGRWLFENRHSGPYTVGGLVLSEVTDDDYIQVDTYETPYQTAGYAFSAFERDAHVRLNGDNFDQAFDQHGEDFLFDALMVRLGIDVDSTATYHFSVSLADSTDAEIAWADGQASLEAGSNSLTIEFPGSAIGAHGADGPYHVRDLALFAGQNLLFALGTIFATNHYSAFDFEGSIPPSQRLYITGRIAYDDSLYGADSPIHCNLVVAYDTKDKCAGCDSTALDSIMAARIAYAYDGTFLIGPILNQDRNDDQGPLDIVVRAYLKSNEACWTEDPSSRWPITLVDATGAPWHFDSQVFSNATGDTLDVGELKPSDDAHRSAFHLFKNLEEHAWWTGVIEEIQHREVWPESVRVVWSPGYSIDLTKKGTLYNPATRTLYVDGRLNASTYSPDEWDDIIVTREYGHAVAQGLGVLASSSGTRGPCESTESDSLAWNEGFATYFASSVHEYWGLDPAFVDHGRDPSGATSARTIDIESGCVTPACVGGCPNSAGSGGELAVAGALWDLFDSVNDNPNGDAFGDSASEGDSYLWSLVRSTRPYMRKIQDFETAFLTTVTPYGPNPRRNWLAREVFLEHGIGVSFTGAEEVPAPLLRLTLHPGRPNPFNPSVRIDFDLPGTGSTRVHLTVFNVRGERVRTLVDSFMPSGRQHVTWDGRDSAGRDASSGVYFCKLETRLGDRSMKLVLAR